MANQGASPVDFTSPVGQTRVLMGDTDAANIEGDHGDYAWFGDDELGVFLTLNGNDPRRAAVAALRIVAMTPAMKLRKWQSADLAVDGPAITKELAALISSIEAGIAAVDQADSYFSIDGFPAPPRPGQLMPLPQQAGPPYLIPGYLVGDDVAFPGVGGF